MILAPMRGVTGRCFRETFARLLRESGFSSAVRPFVAANPGFDPLKDRELAGGPSKDSFPADPQFIGKDPGALREALAAVKEAGWKRADLNAGCPFPMIRRRGRGSGLMADPALLEKMLAAGCETMGEGNFSVKTRLGLERPDEILRLMPVFNSFPLRFVAIHARTVAQMYSGVCDTDAFSIAAAASANPVVYNGDAQPGAVRVPPGAADVMAGRPFVRALGARADAPSLVRAYAAASVAELGRGSPALGRLKELCAYWKELPRWRRAWTVLKIARSCEEFLSALPRGDADGKGVAAP